jgi:GAF domain-containing protein
MQVVNGTLSRLRDHLGMDGAYITELNGGDMIVRAHCAPSLPAELPAQFAVPREAGFCHYLANGEIPSIVQDSSKNAITADLPMRHEIGIEAYIGVPLAREDGSVYGTLCCFSHKPNTTLNDRDLQTVKLFSELVIGQIDGELEDRRVSQARHALIQNVLDQNLLRPAFQPIFSLVDQSVKGFEALARFNTDSYRTPDKWFADAAQIGRGVELELEAIKRSLECAKQLPSACSVGLNVSPECLISDGNHP